MLTQVNRGESAPRPVAHYNPGKGGYNKAGASQGGPRNRSVNNHRTGPQGFVS